ncbi:MAG: hypothetical protein NC936_05740 [Candidatus Omnitrophica bacterium]|nr:hypothetical protein [Candidatus Omnitrophota bacterium]
MSLRNLLIVILLICLFLIFRPQIMRWLGPLIREFTYLGRNANTTYQEFKHHDIYKREKAIEKTLDKY